MDMGVHGCGCSRMGFSVGMGVQVDEEPIRMGACV